MKVIWKILLVVTLPFLLYSLFMIGLLVLAMSPLYLAVGWLFFLQRVVPQIEMNYPMALSGLTAFGLALCLLHSFLKRLPSRFWTWRLTLNVTSLFLSLFGAATVITGIVHQLGWLIGPHEPLVRSTFDGTVLTNARIEQVLFRLIENGKEKNRYPESLEKALTTQNEDVAKWLWSPGQGVPPEPWIYLGTFLNTLPADAKRDELPLLVSPGRTHHGGYWQVTLANGARRSDSNLRELLPSGLPPEMMAYLVRRLGSAAWE